MNELVVESRADPTRGTVPVRFGLAGRPMQEVADVIDWWPGEGHRYFRVRVRYGGEFVLRHDLAEDAWRLDFFQATSDGEPRP